MLKARTTVCYTTKLVYTSRACVRARAFKYFHRETQGLSFVVNPMCGFKCETSDKEFRMKHCFCNLYLYVLRQCFIFTNAYLLVWYATLYLCNFWYSLIMEHEEPKQVGCKV